MLVCVSIRVGRGTRPQRYGPHAHGRRAGRFPRGPTRVPVGAPPHRCRQTAAAAPLHPPTVVVWRRFPQTTGRRPCAARCVARAHPPPPPPPHPTGCRLGACPSPTRVRPTDRRQGVWAPKGVVTARRTRAPSTTGGSPAWGEGEAADREPTRRARARRLRAARAARQQRTPARRPCPTFHAPPVVWRVRDASRGRPRPACAVPCVRTAAPSSEPVGGARDGDHGDGAGGEVPRSPADRWRRPPGHAGIHGLADGCAKDPRVGRVGWHLRPTASTPPSKKNSESVTGALERPSTEEHGGWGVRL